MGVSFRALTAKVAGNGSDAPGASAPATWPAMLSHRASKQAGGSAVTILPLLARARPAQVAGVVR